MANHVVRWACCLRRSNPHRLLNVSRSCGFLRYAEKVDAKAAAAQMVPERQFLETEKDVNKLCNSVVGLNIYKDGEDPELKPESEYPDWLWELRTEPKSPALEELEPDSTAYWNKLRKLDRKKKALTLKMKHKFKEF